MKSIMFAIVLLIYSLANIYADTKIEYNAENKEERIFDPAKKIKAELMMVAGYGFDKITLGKNPDNNETLLIRFGGGIGAAISMGYCFSSLFELNFALIYQIKMLDGRNTGIFDQDKIDGSFRRPIYLITPKINIPVSKRSQIKFGAGIGYYGPAKFIYERTHTTFLLIIPLWQESVEYVYTYKGNAGYHLTGEYEYFFTGSISASIGLKYYYTSYSMESIKADNTQIPVSREIKDFMGKVDGDGMDYTFSFSIYF